MTNTIEINSNHLNMPAAIFLQNAGDNPDFIVNSHKYTEYDKGFRITADQTSNTTRYTITHDIGFSIPMLLKSKLPTELISIILLAMTQQADTIVIAENAPYYPGELNTYGHSLDN